ncbi:MAG: 50S ribosomal protein L25, partial [Pseudomonadota bacterium]
FQRVSRRDTITMSVPLNFTGEEECPGVKFNGGIMSHSILTVDISCLGSDLPESIEVDVSEMDLGDSYLLGQVTLPEGVEFASTVQDTDLELPVASVLAPKKATAETTDEETVEGEGAEAESDSGEEAAPEE